MDDEAIFENVEKLAAAEFSGNRFASLNARLRLADCLAKAGRIQPALDHLEIVSRGNRVWQEMAADVKRKNLNLHLKIN